LEYGVGDGRRGPQALAATILEQGPAPARVNRKSPEDMTRIVEDLIKVLDGVSNTLRRGRYPEKKTAAQTAHLLRAVAENLEA
jgi:CspA family cold shock protein